MQADPPSPCLLVARSLVARACEPAQVALRDLSLARLAMYLRLRAQ